jgi:hypothetical protein
MSEWHLNNTTTNNINITDEGSRLSTTSMSAAMTAQQPP